MKKNFFKQLLSSLLIAVMLFSSIGVAFSASSTDIAGHWAEKQISTWIDKGLVKGYENGSFKPENNITRAEFITLVNRSFGFTEKAAISFSDLPSGNWAYPEIAIAIKAGYITGYADGTISANKSISRQEAAVIADRLLGLTNTQSTAASFTDSSSIALWAKGSVDAVVAKGIMKGYAEDNSFKPSKLITRAEAIVTLDRAIEAKAVVYDTAGTYGPETGTATINSDVIIKVTGVTLRNTIINGNLIFAAGIEEGDSFLNNVTIKGSTTVAGGGINSIHFRKSTMGKVLVNKDKTKGPVRIVIDDDSTTIEEVIVQSSATIQSTEGTGASIAKVTLSEQLPEDSVVTLLGTFDTLDVKGAHIQVNIPEGSVKEVTVESTATGTTLNLGVNTKVDKLEVDAVSTITGAGTIETATLNSVAKAGTTFENPPAKIVDKVESSASPSPTSTPTATPTPTPGPTAPSGSTPSTGSSDTTPPTLSSVTAGQISVGDSVVGTSNESGYLFLVPSATSSTVASLNIAVDASLGKKLTVSAGVNSSISTTGLVLGSYVLYAVDSSNNISTASAEIVIGKKQLTIGDPVVSVVESDDGDSVVEVTAGALVGAVTGEDVTVNAEAVYDISRPALVPLTVVYTLTGADKENYIAPVDNNNYTAKVQLNPDMGIVIDLITSSKVYDGTTLAAVIAGSRVGDRAVDGDGNCDLTDKDGICFLDDAVVQATGAYDDSQVGTNKAITLTYTLIGEDTGNYYFPVNYFTVNTGIITAKQLTITNTTLVTNSKVYDGNTTAVVTAGQLIGVVNNDIVTVSAIATYTDAAVGTGKTITVVYTLGGRDAANYIAPASYTVNTGVITAN